MLNRFILQGRIVFEPKLQNSKDLSYINFRVAWTSSFKDGAGNKKTYFFNVTSFSKTAEFISKYFKKGDMILIEGDLRDNDKKIELIASNVFFCNSNTKSDTQKSEQTSFSAEDTADLPF